MRRKLSPTDYKTMQNLINRVTLFNDTMRDMGLHKKYLDFCKQNTHVNFDGRMIPTKTLLFTDYLRYKRLQEVQLLPELQSSDLAFSEAFTDYEEVGA
jgi:hypothetical protein